jgi:hypothetical protein
LAELLSERVSPEMLYLETKFAALVSYGLTVRLMDEVLPLDRPIGAERVRRHLFRVAEAHEAELASAPTNMTVDERTGPNNALPDGPLYVGMDCGTVDAADPSGRSSAASDPNTRPQRRSRSTHRSPLSSVQESGSQRPCPRFAMGSKLDASPGASPT